MGRKPKEESISDYLDASYILDRPKNVIKVSPAIDVVLSGGIPESCIVILQGMPKIGKTSLALKIAAKAQQQFGKTVIYTNVENRLSQKNLTGVKGLDTSPEKFRLISSQEGNILGAEQFLEKTERALINFPNCICIFDSFSSLSSSSEKTGNYGEGFGNVGSRKMEGEFSRRISPIVQVNNSIIIGMAHVTPNLNMPGNSTKISRALMYQMDINLSMKKVYPNGDWKSGDKIIGQKVEVSCLTSALGGPGNSCVTYLKYGEGFSDFAELAQLAIDLSLIQKSGSWLVIEKFNKKVQGMEDLCGVIEENPEIYTWLEEQIKEMLK